MIKTFKKTFKRAPKPGFIGMRKKFCRFCKDKVRFIDYKDIRSLEKFLSDRGKMFSSRLTGTCAKHQRRVAIAIKRARYIALLPYNRY
jgi:small subunit ribosomal protein S18